MLGLLARNDWNWPEAERQYRIAISRNTNCAECSQHYAALQQVLGRNEDAVREVNRAIELDPLNDQNRLLLAFIAFTSHQHDLAISRYKELHVSRPPLAWSYAGKGMYPEAIATAKNCEIKVGGPLCVAGLAYVYGLAGKKREAREAINRLSEVIGWET